jgi:hypothetical protein
VCADVGDIADIGPIEITARRIEGSAKAVDHRSRSRRIADRGPDFALAGAAGQATLGHQACDPLLACPYSGAV